MKKYFIVNDCFSTNQLFEEVNGLLLENNAVEKSFLKAITEREAKFPTGLETAGFVEGGYNAAIPHVECEHCKSDALVFVLSKKPILWKDMVFKKPLEVNFFVFIISSSGGAHMLLLPKVIEVLKDIEFQEGLKKVVEVEEFKCLVNNKFGGEKDD